MRIGILGPAAWFHTGYSVQIGHLARLLPALGHETAVFAFTGLQGSPIKYGGVTVYPKLHDYMGQDMAMHALHFRADVVIPVMDVWPVALPAWEGIRLAPW